MKRVLAALVVVAAVASPAAADVRMVSTMSATGPMAMQGQQTISIKGSRMRMDMSMMGTAMSMIGDAESGTSIMLNHGAKTAEKLDAARLTAGMQQNLQSVGDVKMELKPNGQTKTLLGQTCVGHALNGTIPVSVGDTSVTMTISGVIWMASNGPGAAEYAAFMRQAAKANLLTGGQPVGPQSRGLTAIQQALTGLEGIPYEQEINIAFNAEGSMADTLNSLTFGLVFSVTSISTDPIADDVFQVPAGYTVK